MTNYTTILSIGFVFFGILLVFANYIQHIYVIANVVAWDVVLLSVGASIIYYIHTAVRHKNTKWLPRLAFMINLSMVLVLITSLILRGFVCLPLEYKLDCWFRVDNIFMHALPFLITLVINFLVPHEGITTYLFITLHWWIFVVFQGFMPFEAAILLPSLAIWQHLLRIESLQFSFLSAQQKKFYSLCWFNVSLSISYTFMLFKCLRFPWISPNTTLFYEIVYVCTLFYSGLKLSDFHIKNLQLRFSLLNITLLSIPCFVLINAMNNIYPSLLSVGLFLMVYGFILQYLYDYRRKKVREWRTTVPRDERE